ncbi:hypothetical protein BN13_10005 [Nostocoides jenkinsii Ben 74]|uniref:Uncharacterized protein n=1 Tax=Nostocoides jenkinsii Ben 74 TaxID=1193518 RepID=A0A077M906_9MICO|nr:hypothetical protein BN13_10005 [Tetrasphaera jenkinsii Ben 74]
MTGPLLDRAAIEAALTRLGERLVRRGVVADLYVFGGAAMTLAYDRQLSTLDIDAVWQPHEIRHRRGPGGSTRVGSAHLVAQRASHA